MKTIVLVNQKGGVGKSTLAALLAHHLANQDLRVLAIDLDHQGSFTRHLSRSKRAQFSGVAAENLLGRAGQSVPSYKFVYVRASERLLELERQAASHKAYVETFRGFVMAQDERFDVCIIDTSAHPNICVVSALAAADYVLVPIQVCQEGADGIRDLLLHPRYGIYAVKVALNMKLELIGLLPSMVEDSPTHDEDFAQFVEWCGPLLIRVNATGRLALIPRRPAIGQAQGEGEVLCEGKATAHRDVWREIEPSIAAVVELVVGQALRQAAAA